MRRHGEKIRVGSTKASLSFSLSEGEGEEEEEDVALRNSEECEYGKCKTMCSKCGPGTFWAVFVFVLGSNMLLLIKSN